MNTAPRRLALVATAVLGAPALADTPAQTDYDAEFYLLFNTGDIALGSLALGVSDELVPTTLGPLANAAEFTPDGRLVGVGGNLGSNVVAYVDTETGALTPIFDQADADAALPGFWYFSGLTIADDGTYYVFAAVFRGLFETDIIHIDSDGNLLHTSTMHTADGDTVLWNSQASTCRSDGMLISAHWSDSTSIPGGNIATVDPGTGLITPFADYSHAGDRLRGLTTLGGTTFASLGNRGEDIYTIDLDTGDLEFVVTLTGLPAGDEAFGFAMLPDPCAADMTYDRQLNVSDVDTFVGAFLAGSTAADLDYNKMHNIDDIDVFVASFLTGCD